MKNNKLKIILSGGGTGGHIFPAIAIANAIKHKHPDAEILFVGALGRMEMEKVPAAGYPIEGLWISGLQRRLTFENVKFPLKVVSSLLKARKIIKNFKPDVVIGTGGYASGPTLRAAAWAGVPTLIQEQNSFPGITNKMLAKKANVICVAYPGMEKYFPADKIRLTGNPVRTEIESPNCSQHESLAFFGLQPNKTTLLVVGGSLGARTINQSIHKSIDSLIDNNIQLLWQTGKGYADTALAATAGLSGKGIISKPFIAEMDKAYACADMVVSRAGAIAISELCINGKATILVPSPNVAEDHQTKNARALSDRGAAILVTDMEAPATLTFQIIDLAKDKNKRSALSENIKKLAIPHSADRIAEMALELVKQHAG